jgi:hypothetical protein
MTASLRDLGSLAGNPDVGAEALAHVGLLKFHRNDLAGAEADLTRAARDATDPFVQNLAWLGAGLAFDADGQDAAATAAYAAAATALPRARASAIQLATHLQSQGRVAEAAQTVAFAFGPDTIETDPWRHVLAFDRLLESDIAVLRSALGVPPAARSQARKLDVDSPAVPPSPSSSSLSVAPAAPISPPQVQAFRSRADGVSFDVLVESNGVPVDGLTARDFVVLDNGEPQTVEVVDLKTLPIDVSLVVDFYKEATVGTFTLERTFPDSRQYTTTSSWMSPDVYPQVRKDVASVAEALGSTDRLRVMQVDGGVGRELWSFQTPPFPLERLPEDAGGRPSLASLRQASYGRMQGLYDVAAAALLHLPPMDRRHIVVVFTDGIDGASVLPPSRFLSSARNSQAVMYLLRRDTQTEIAALQGIKSATPYAHLYWPPDARVIEEAAISTGGTVFHHPDGAILSDLKRILDLFRRSYVVRYQPTHATAGWHETQIRISKPGNYRVKARAGYNVK